MKAIVIFDTLELGGAERQGLLFARYLKSQGWDVAVWGLVGPPGRVSSLCDATGIRWRAVELDWKNRLLQAPHNLRVLRNLAAQLRAEHCDVLLPYTYKSNVIAGLVWRQSGARGCVWNQRDLGFYFDLFDPWRTVSTRLVQSFVANSEASAATVRALTHKPVTVVRNGVELAAPQTDWRPRFASSFVATMIANLHANKDHATLVRAWRDVVARIPDAMLVFAGREEETARSTRGLIAELGLTDRVTLLGPVDDIPGLLAATDVYVHSASSESSPNAVIEAMVAGKSIVASDIPGIRETVGDAGLLVSREGFASTILRVAQDHELRHALSKSAMDRARRYFSPERMCETMLRYVEQQLETR